MACSNCYNGCTEIISDQCVKYTGVDVPVLGIQTGDSLSYVEQALIGFLTSTLDGTGIKLVIDPDIICEIINKNLVECEDLTLVNVINALIKAVCELDTRVTALEDDFAALEGPYTIGCLTGVTSTSGTHAILQATITKLCSVEVALNALALNVSTNYVKLADLNSLIAAYLASVGTTTKYYNRMVPYAVVEYYGPLTGNFDATGAGLGDWEKIYLCNGNNGTPDKRGRVPVGATTGMGGGALNPAVDPAVAGNPAYALLGTAGSNTVTLSPTQIPAHSHSATATVVDNHYHFVAASDSTGSCDIITSTDPVARAGSCGTNPAYELRKSGETTATLGKSSGAQGTIDVSVAIGSTGGGLAHSNYQPGLGCYYIMYIP
jgi:microcystin-dependent protein